MTIKRVTLSATFEYNNEQILEENTDEQLIELAKEAFYLDGTMVSATVETIDETSERTGD